MDRRTFMRAIAGIAAAIVVGPSVITAATKKPPPDLLDGLVAYWPMREREGPLWGRCLTAVDISGKGNNGLLINNPCAIIGVYRPIQMGETE